MSRHTWRFTAETSLPSLDPDEAQRSVMDWAVGPALVLAGPGTGKTSTLVAAALQRLAEGAPPASVLMLTLGREAANELRGELALRLGSGEPPRVSTFHAFALDLVSRSRGAAAPLRLLSAAEQERAVREVLDGTMRDAEWPADLLEALPTRGFAQEVRAAFAAARALGLAGDEVHRIGKRAGSAAWSAVGPVLDEYLDSQEQQFAFDYAELMFRAVHVAHDPRNAALLRHLRHIYVDEFQETDRMQVALLRELARFSTSLVCAGDPDQSVFGFRGADPRNIRDFTTDFSGLGSAMEPQVLTLRINHRFGPAIRNAVAGIFGGIVPTGVPATWDGGYRMPACARTAGEVHAFLYDDALAEAAWIASRIRALGQETGAAWENTAVIARSASALGPIERALQRAGIPSVSDVRDSRLADQPAVQTLLRALETVSGRQLSIDPSHAISLLESPMCGLDPVELRAIGRALRTDRTVPSERAVALALTRSHPSFELEHVFGAERFESLRLLLHSVHARVAAGTTPHEALWLLWSGTQWPALLQRQALQHGSALAHRDLDAVCELFDIADRSVQRRHGHAGVSSFLYELRAQEIPAETLAGRGFRGAGVQLLTAHRAKGNQWEHVFVAAVTDGVWPNLRRRSAILDVDSLTREGIGEPRGRAALFDEDRRLFYLACSRARTSLTISGSCGEESQPSRLLDRPALPPIRVQGRPQSIDSPAGLIAELRRHATGDDAAIRSAAIERLRSLRALRDAHGMAIFPEADPRQWWGTRERTVSAVPVDAPAAPLYVRGSSLELLRNCSLSWFLQQRASAEGTRGSAVVFGSAMHALVDGVTRGELSSDAMIERLREVWNPSAYEAEWQSRRDFEQAAAAIARFLQWHAKRAGMLVASEVNFDQVIDVATPEGSEQLRMRGTVDRIEIGDGGATTVIDFKTSRAAATQAEVREHAQLRYYQYAVRNGLLGGLGCSPALKPEGAQLVYLRLDAGRGSPGPKVLQQPALGEDAEAWAREVLGAGLNTVRRERFEAVSGKHCSMCSMKLVCPLQREGQVENA